MGIPGPGTPSTAGTWETRGKTIELCERPLDLTLFFDVNDQNPSSAGNPLPLEDGGSQAACPYPSRISGKKGPGRESSDVGWCIRAVIALYACGESPWFVGKIP